MPNIIVNNYCNQKCTYCFAHLNMNDISLKKDMSLFIFLNIIKYLKLNNDNKIRILGGEPFLFSNINNFLKIALKGNFKITIFSNININSGKLQIALKGIDKIKISCNINNKSFYSPEEITKISSNIYFFIKKKYNIILGYNIIDTKIKPDLIFELAKKYNIKNIVLKITNSSIGSNLIIDNSNRKLGIYIFNLIKKYYKIYNIEISCGLDKNIFLQNEIDFINEKTNIDLKYGCDGNIGKFDINTNGSIIRCFPLKKLFKNKIIHINELIKKQVKYSNLFKLINKGIVTNGECIGNKNIKSKLNKQSLS